MPWRTVVEVALRRLAFDDLGDYANAMGHFVAANGIRRRLSPSFSPNPSRPA